LGKPIGFDFRASRVGGQFGETVILGKSAIVRAGAKRADVANDDEVIVPERPEQLGPLRTEKCDHRNAQGGGDVAGAAVVADDLRCATHERKQLGHAQPGKGMPGQIVQGAAIAVRIGNEDELKFELLAQRNDELPVVGLGPTADGNPGSTMKRDDGPGILAQLSAKLFDEGGVRV